MKDYIRNLGMLFRHKWFVFVAGTKLIGAPFHRIILHNLNEIFYKTEDDFRTSKNKSDWRYWVYIDQDGVLKPRLIPEKYVYEMVANWMACIRESGGEFSEIADWYNTNSEFMLIHPDTDHRINFMFYFNGYTDIIPTWKDNSSDTLKSTTEDDHYCFRCQSFHPKTQPCLCKRKNW